MGAEYNEEDITKGVSFARIVISALLTPTTPGPTGRNGRVFPQLRADTVGSLPRQAISPQAQATTRKASSIYQANTMELMWTPG
jgi:hypothetical protein